MSRITLGDDGPDAPQPPAAPRHSPIIDDWYLRQVRTSYVPRVSADAETKDKLAPLEFSFEAEPTFAQLWELCVYNLLYDESRYCDDIERVFAERGITQNSRIIDVAAGGGFPSLGLVERGYAVENTDGSPDEVELFNRRAAERGLPTTCDPMFWSELPQHFDPASYDFLFCRGNSFIYAPGGWNQDAEIDTEAALTAYEDAARTFCNLLKPGGYAFFDKFRDSETTHRETVMTVRVAGGSPEKLVFWTQRFPEQRIRRAMMLREREDGTTIGVPNVSYNLTEPELTGSLLRAGFSSVEPLSLPSEGTFDTWIAKK